MQLKYLYFYILNMCQKICRSFILVNKLTFQRSYINFSVAKAMVIRGGNVLHTIQLFPRVRQMVLQRGSRLPDVFHDVTS